MRKLKAPPKPTMPDNLEDAQLIINEQYHYILCLLDKFNTNSTNSSKPPSSDFNKNNRSKNNNERGNGTPKKKNKAGAQEGHKGSKRNLEPLKETDTIVDCFADRICSQCGEGMIANKTPSYRHQVFELPKTPLHITEYRLFNSHCSCCDHQEKGKLPDDASPYQIGPSLQAFVAYLSCGTHMSLSKIQQVLLSTYGTTFSIGALNEANQRTGRLLKPTAEDLHHAVQKSPQVFIDETRHNRNGEAHQRWMWLMSNKLYVFCDIKYYRNAETAKRRKRCLIKTPMPS